MLQYVQVGKRFESRWIFSRFSLDAKPGELVWLSGAPGAGKSVLVRMAQGLTLPTTGVVTVNGANPAKLGATGRIRLRRGVAAVTGEADAADLACERWFAFGLWCAGRAWRPSVRAAREWLGRLEMSERARTPFGALGPGARTALELARGLARTPGLLVADPARPFEEALPDVLIEELARFVQEGGAALIVGAPGERTAKLAGRQERLAGEERA